MATLHVIITITTTIHVKQPQHLHSTCGLVIAIEEHATKDVDVANDRKLSTGAIIGLTRPMGAHTPCGDDVSLSGSETQFLGVR